MTTETDICNRALDILKEAPISSIDDNRPIAMWLKRNFYVTRDALLAVAEWNFALTRASIAADEDEPAFGWDYSFTIPSDCIRLLPLTYEGRIEGINIPHEIEGGKILTNESGPLKARYVSRTEDYASYPATFQEALSARLAGKMAHWLTGKSSFVQIAKSIYADAMNEAWLHDATQGTVPRGDSDEWVSLR
jgi:hypothetical protein